MSAAVRIPPATPHATAEAPTPGAGFRRHRVGSIAAALATAPVFAQRGKGRGTGTHLVFKTERETLDVHVGPTRWLADRKYGFAKGDILREIAQAGCIRAADGKFVVTDTGRSRELAAPVL